MPKSEMIEKYADKPKREAELIKESYEKRVIPNKEEENRSWAPVNFEEIQRLRIVPSCKKANGYRGL